MRDRQPWFDLHDDSCEQPDVSVLGLPYDGGVGFRAGAAAAPERLRQISRTSDPITRRGRNLRGLRLRDYGDVEAMKDGGKPVAARTYLDAARQRLEGPASADELWNRLGEVEFSDPWSHQHAQQWWQLHLPQL